MVRDAPELETLGAQALAAFIVGSYFLAEHVKARRPQRRGQRVAIRATEPPPARAEAAYGVLSKSA